MFMLTNISDWTAMTVSEASGLHRGQTEPYRVLLVKVEIKKKFLLIYLGFKGQNNLIYKASKNQITASPVRL